MKGNLVGSIYTNQKQELPLAAMLVNGSELNEQSLLWTFQGCFLPSFFKNHLLKPLTK
jgi:hypothetical protein